MGFAAEVSHCLYLCGETYRRGNKGATNDMLVRSTEKQGWAALLRAARAAEREAGGSTQLIRAAKADDLPRVLQLVQLGATLELKDTGNRWTALHWACYKGHEHVARALLDGKYEGRGAKVDASTNGVTPLMFASYIGFEGIARLLLAHGARQELQDRVGNTALHDAVCYDHAGIVALLCAAPGAAAALALRNSDGHTPLGLAVNERSAACEALLRTRGAPL
jgi:ankyrin repeat protein